MIYRKLVRKIKLKNTSVKRIGWCVGTYVLSFALSERSDALNIKDNDTVVLVGNTFVERAQQCGHIEASLTLALGKKNVKYRNLGWSGDSVFGHARSYFGPPSEGISRLRSDLETINPNVVLLCYGAVAAFDGKDGITDFLQGYTKLLNMIKECASPREIVLLTPPPAETLAAPFPNMDIHNKRLQFYSEEIGKLAKQEKVQYADLFSAIGVPVSNSTINGIHYDDKGYSAIAPALLTSLGIESTIDKIDTKHIDSLRTLIKAKNRFFFYRWRPANETYLRLFRKHEQE